MYSWESSEVHRVPQRAAHYTGELDPVNTFFQVFFGGRKPPLKEPPANGYAFAKMELFPRKYWLFGVWDRLTPVDHVNVGPPLVRGFRRGFVCESRRFVECHHQVWSRSARQSLYSCWSMSAFRKRSRLSVWGISKWPKRSSSCVMASVAPA